MNFRHPLHGHKKRKKGDTASLAAQLAPLEERDAKAAKRQQGANAHGNGNGGGGLIQDHGALIVDTEHLNISQSLGGTGEGEKKHFLGIEPVVLVILLGVLAFIAFIAWQISLMPPAE